MIRPFPAFVFAVSALSLIAALLLQSVGYTPCELCLLERFPWYAALLLGLGSVHIHPIKMLWVYVVLAVIFVASMALGLYHAGVEQHLWAGPTACTAPTLAAPGSLAALKASLMGPQPVSCDTPMLSLWGFTLADANAVLSLAMAAITIDQIGNHPRA